MHMMGRLILIASFSVALVPAQVLPPCAEQVSRFPAYSNQEVAPQFEARFELRRCPWSNLIRVLQFERGAKRPAVDFQIPDSTRATYHSFNVLVTQTVGGSGSAVRMFWFKRGKAQEIVEEDAQSNFQIRVNDKGELVVEVPVRRGRTGPGIFRFPIEVVLHEQPGR
ncbi:MAG: hypothetical protein ABI972_12350 [Acidobacteriota bacterium]